MRVVPSYGLPSPTATASLKRTNSPSPMPAKRLRLTCKNIPVVTPTESHHTLPPKYPSEGISHSDIFREYASSADMYQRARAKQTWVEPQGLSTDTKSRALQMIQWALSSNEQLKNEYTPTCILGWGGCGAVFEAQRKRDIATVAIKIVYKNSKRSGIPTEIDILSRLAHPNIIGYIGHFEDARAHYLVMERFGKLWKNPSKSADDVLSFSSLPQILYRSSSSVRILSGTSSSLFEYIDYNKCGKVPSRSLRPLFKQICLSVSHLHQLGIVHGDIKEENILIGAAKNGRLLAKLCDFGHATRVDSRNPRMRLYGTRVLTPPELLCHLRAEETQRPTSQPLCLGLKQDIWALGIVFWTMLHGSLPAENDMYISGGYDLDRFSCYPASYAAITDPVCLDLLQKMLWIDPKGRFDISQVLDHPFFK
ncbi:Checkpoint kinase 2 [Kappamyces sp. JEL0680]|nr:Checkpoint kinase 2 [Kappamyces sp. JEL0680]